MNKGNLVNRIGVACRQMWIARFIAFVSIGLAVAAWFRPVKKAEAVPSLNSCQQYTQVMCTNVVDASTEGVE